jgi:uncharacterized protein YfdQ (DUF2303 family)
MESPHNLIDLKLIQDLGVAASAPKTIPGYQPVILVPDNFEMKTPLREDEIPLADHIRQRVVLFQLASFTNYIKKFKRHTTQIFGCSDQTGAKFSGVIDYHEAGVDGKPDHLKHVADYAPRYSDEFSAWLGINAKPLTQDQFLDHLRRWGYVITSHTDADMIELASSLEFKTDGQFASQIERTRGGRKLLWNEEVAGTGSVAGKAVTVPDAIKLKMAIFDAGKEYELDADLLYRVAGGKLHIAVEMKRFHKVIRMAVEDLILDVETATEIEVFMGNAAV